MVRNAFNKEYKEYCNVSNIISKKINPWMSKLKELSYELSLGGILCAYNYAEAQTTEQNEK